MGLLPNHLPTRSLSHAKHLTTLSLAITIGFSAVVGTVLWESRSRDREQAKQAASNVIALLSSEIDRNLELYDLSLQAVVDGMKLPALTELSPEMRQLVLFDRAATAKIWGRFLFSGRTERWSTIPERSSQPRKITRNATTSGSWRTARWPVHS